MKINEDRPISHYEMNRAVLFDPQKGHKDVYHPEAKPSEAPRERTPAKPMLSLRTKLRANKQGLYGTEHHVIRKEGGDIHGTAPDFRSAVSQTPKGGYVEDPSGRIVHRNAAPMRKSVQDAINAVVADLIEDLPVDEDTTTGSIAAIPVPMGSKEETCPCGSGKPKSQCTCNKQAQPIQRSVDTISGKGLPVDRGSRLRRIVATLGGI